LESKVKSGAKFKKVKKSGKKSGKIVGENPV
jgi:hypothetical protein